MSGKFIIENYRLDEIEKWDGSLPKVNGGSSIVSIKDL